MQAQLITRPISDSPRAAADCAKINFNCYLTERILQILFGRSIVKGFCALQFYSCLVAPPFLFFLFYFCFSIFGFVFYLHAVQGS